MGSLRLSQSPMEVELRLDQKEAIYTSRDTVSGEVVLHTESPADLSTIVLTLSATATSRLTKSRRTETHKLFKKSQQLFPSDPLLKQSKRSSVTIGGGNHILRFSTTFPQVTECYKSSLHSARPQIACANMGFWRKEKSHLLRKSPPSTGKRDLLAEIQYSLTVIVTGKSVVKKTQNLTFCSSSDPILPQEPFRQNCLINLSPQILDTELPLSFRIDTELQNGPCLLLDCPIPLSIKITKLGDSYCNIRLNGFQTMLIETTQVKAQGRVESSTNTWMVQTAANMNYPIELADASNSSTVFLNDLLWANNRLSAGPTSSFEVCNIKRTYKLSIRLGFLVGNHKLQTMIRDFEFPVYVMGLPVPHKPELDFLS